MHSACLISVLHVLCKFNTLVLAFDVYCDAFIANAITSAILFVAYKSSLSKDGRLLYVVLYYNFSTCSNEFSQFQLK